ncbi:hypothetical protein Tcan_18366 [Toxocara canis]|uniref:Uncharacterized protein n=2 Tax=Toxocara canis TaxID=6265 RepID=A0A0B2V8S8_TOXCA|nr:hypothetical protein Tcan_18366 [Toxocara canis]VDM42968.1 unnamed protein product [Toxocara canis]
MWYMVILFALVPIGNSRYIDDERHKGSYFYEARPIDTFADGVQSLSRASELPKLPLMTVKDVEENGEDSDEILAQEMIINLEKPLFDESGTIITYPDKQLLDINDKEGQRLQEPEISQKSKGTIPRPWSDCIPRDEQDEVTSESAEETAAKEAADELLSPVDDGIDSSKHSRNFTGSEIVEEPFILVTVRPLCPY